MFQNIKKQTWLLIGSHFMAFLCGVIVGLAYCVGEKESSGSLNNEATSSPQNPTNSNILPPAVVSENAQDWTFLVDNMCQEKSELNVLASQFDFPFDRCQNAQGEIDGACVNQDAQRFKVNFPKPYLSNIKGLKTVLETSDNWQDMFYILPLENATYRGMPMQAIAINVDIGNPNSTETRGWQTPYVVIQDDFSKIKDKLAEQSQGKLHAQFNDGLKAITLGCGAD